MTTGRDRRLSESDRLPLRPGSRRQPIRRREPLRSRVLAQHAIWNVRSSLFWLAYTFGGWLVSYIATYNARRMPIPNRYAQNPPSLQSQSPFSRVTTMQRAAAQASYGVRRNESPILATKPDKSLPGFPPLRWKIPRNRAQASHHVDTASTHGHFLLFMGGTDGELALKLP